MVIFSFPDDVKMFGHVQFETKALGSLHCTQFQWTQKNGSYKNEKAVWTQLYSTYLF